MTLVVTADEALWRRWLADFPLADVHDTPDFHSVAAMVDPGVARCARFEDDAGTLLFPFLLRSLRGCADVSSAYDFGGYLVRGPPGHAAALVMRFRDAWRAWCAQVGVVSEFIRFHPLRFPPAGEVGLEPLLTLHQDHVVVRLDQGIDAARARYSPSCRRAVRKATRAGLVLDQLGRGPQAASWFAALYAQTMARRDAPRWYRFPEAYFVAMGERLPEVEIFAVRHGDERIAGGIFLRGGDTLFYFLGASDEASFELRPNNLLFDGVASWAASQRIRQLHLGGGSGELLRFKAGFSPERVHYFVHREIHDEARYAELVAAASAEATASLPRHFPLYRAAEWLPPR